MYYSERLDKAKFNMKLTWGSINELIGKKTRQLPKENMKLNDTIINPEDAARTFNSFFVNLGPNLASKLDKPN